MQRDERRMTFIVVPHGGEDLATRSFEISYRRLKVAALLLVIAGLLWAGSMASWGLLAAQAARLPAMQRQVDRLEEENGRVEQLAGLLRQLEARYRQLQVMHGADVIRPLGNNGGESPSGGNASADSAAASIPASWPLDARGYVTRGHLARVTGQHPGMDIAVREGSRVRATGAGRVAEVGEDSIYGTFVRIEHITGYESMYGHLSRVLVGDGGTVARDQVIALSGNTGLSTAPHLHFEIRKEGEPVDPRSLVPLPR